MVRDPHGMLVGVDGSEASLQAADWAAADAVVSGRTLKVCFVSDLSVLADVPLPQAVREEARAHGGRLVDRAIVRVHGTAPAVDVTGRVEEGNPPPSCCVSPPTPSRSCSGPAAPAGSASWSWARSAPRWRRTRPAR